MMLDSTLKSATLRVNILRKNDQTLLSQLHFGQTLMSADNIIVIDEKLMLAGKPRFRY
jgi:hypothetical protein